MVYSCSLPAYQEERKMEINFTNLVEVCNLWRNYDDIDDSWYSVTTIANYFALKQDLWTKYAGPGHWNDPDMLIIGNFGLSYEQSKQQMAIWAILAAPLIMSNDLENIKPEFKEILQNKKIIAVNQDPLGIQGRRIYVEKSIEIWTRPITPNVGDKYSYAVAFVSKRTDGRSYPYNVTLSTIGLENEHGYKFEDLFGDYYSNATKARIGDLENKIVLPSNSIKINVYPSGVVFVKATIVKAEDVRGKSLDCMDTPCVVQIN
ncbi:hypothetical protein M8J77_019402 [Diaphorina citri]|nr:hypothetical protein M8J77_019402 [Diaphorina citri]